MLLCISSSKFLKKGVRYKVVNIGDNAYCLEHQGWFHKVNFMTIEDSREKIIEEILN